jgi:CDP-diacylglycerol--serine O-phosphatidyltransferase
MATLGNALCGFAAIYVVTLGEIQSDPIAQVLFDNRFIIACYLIGLSMVFDALDGQLARFARHTTDFGGQLDSLADAISFGAAPAVIALQTFKFDGVEVPLVVSRLIWAVGGLYVACTLIRLARFNVSNEHGEENHQSFFGLPSPGAAGVVLGLVLMQQDLLIEANNPAAWLPASVLTWLGIAATVLIPPVVAASALLMVSNVRYPHFMNRVGRGNKGISRLVIAIAIVLALVVAHRYTLGLVGIVFLLTGPVSHLRAKRSRMKT